MNVDETERRLEAWLHEQRRSTAPPSLRARVAVIPTDDRYPWRPGVWPAIGRRLTGTWTRAGVLVGLIAMASALIGGAMISGGRPSGVIALPSGSDMSQMPSVAPPSPSSAPSAEPDRWPLDYLTWPTPARPGAQYVLVGSARSVIGTTIDAIDPADGTARTFATCNRGCGVVAALAAAPDGHALALVQGAGVRVLDLRTGLSRSVARCGCTGDSRIAWSPDGSTIAFDGVEGISTVQADGGSPSVLVAPNGRGPTFSPEGTRITYVGLQGAATIGVDGQRPQPLGLGDAFDVASAPEGSRLAYVIDPVDPTYHGAGDPFVAELWVVDPDGSDPVRVHQIPQCCIGAWIGPAAWSPDGRRLAWAGPAGSSANAAPTIVVVSADGSDHVLGPVPIAKGAWNWIVMP